MIMIIIALVIVAITAVRINLERNLEQLSMTTINNVDLLRVKDGTYIGEYKAFPVGAKVKVSIENHRIKSVELIEHDHGQGDGAEVIPKHVVDSQRLDIDVVTGATYSSKVILKAIENALISGIE